MMASMPTSATAAGLRRPVLIFYFSSCVAQLSSSFLRDSLYPLILFGTASMGLRGSLWCPSSAPPVSLSLQPSTKKGAGVQFPPPFAGPERRRRRKKNYIFWFSRTSLPGRYILAVSLNRTDVVVVVEKKKKSVPFRRRRRTPFLIVSLTLCPVFMLVRSVCIFNRSRPSSSSYRIRPPQLWFFFFFFHLWLEYSFRRQLSLKCPVCPVSNVSQRTGEKEFFS